MRYICAILLSVMAFGVAGSSIVPSIAVAQTSVDLPAVARGEPHPCWQAKIDRFQGMALATAGPPIPPTDFEVDHYDIDLLVDFGTETLTGDVSITARSLVAALSNMFIDLEQSMAVSSITRDGTPLSFIQNPERIWIHLDRPFGLGESFTVRIQYSGHPVEGGLLSFSFDTHAGYPVASSLSEPWFARNWWPCKETPTDKATADIAFTVPADMVAASNGTLEEVIDGGSTKTYRWHSSYPIATYLISAAITNFAVFYDSYTPQGGGSMPLEFYCFPEHYADATAVWPITASMIEYFRTVYGEYPFITEKYGMAEFPWGGAMEHQTLTSLGDCCVGAEMIIAHELAHQWWGDMVTCATWHDIWLNEGFATYSEALYWGHLFGDAGYRQYMGWLNDEEEFPGSVYRYDLSDPWSIFSYVVYYKGAWVLHMLRGVLGETDFFEGLMAYREASAFGSATTEDFEAVMEAQSGMTLDWFFDEWVYGVNRPDYAYVWEADTPQPGQLTLVIEQVQTNAPPFKMPVQVDVVSDAGTQRFTVLDSLETQSFVLDVVGNPTSVIFDPDDWILDFHREGIVGVADGAPPARPSLGLIWPQPFVASVTIPVHAPPVSGGRGISLSVFDVTGRLVRTLLGGSEIVPDRVIWDGRRGDGIDVGPGVYFVRLDAAGSSDVRRIVRVR